MAHSMMVSNLKSVRVVSLSMNSSSAMNAMSSIVQAVNHAMTRITVTHAMLNITLRNQSFIRVRVKFKMYRDTVAHAPTRFQAAGCVHLITAFSVKMDII